MATTRAIVFRVLGSLPDNRVMPFEALCQRVREEAPTATDAGVVRALDDIERHHSIAMALTESVSGEHAFSFALAEKIHERPVDALLLIIIGATAVAVQR